MVVADATVPEKPDQASPRRQGERVQVNLQSGLKAVTVFVETHDETDDKLILEEVDRDVALLSPYMQKEILTEGHGTSPSNPIKPPKNVAPDIFRLLMEYCDYHRMTGRSDKERKAHDERYIRMETRRLCELTSAADVLQMKPLVDLASKSLAKLIEGNSPDQIRSIFHLPDDLSEEEKLEPIRNLGEDARIRLLNRLYAKKKHQQALTKAQADPAAVPVKQEQSEDTRSVDELLNFIDGDAKERVKAAAGVAKGAAKAGSAKGKKKRNKKRTSLEQGERSPVPLPGSGAPPDGLEADEGQPSAADASSSEACADGPADPNADTVLDLAEESEYDPEVDLEVEELERRLDTGWEARERELLSLVNAAASQQRYTTLPSLAAFKQQYRSQESSSPSTDLPFPSNFQLSDQPQPTVAQPAAVQASSQPDALPADHPADKAQGNDESVPAADPPVSPAPTLAAPAASSPSAAGTVAPCSHQHPSPEHAAEQDAAVGYDTADAVTAEEQGQHSAAGTASSQDASFNNEDLPPVQPQPSVDAQDSSEQLTARKNAVEGQDQQEHVNGEGVPEADASSAHKTSNFGSSSPEQTGDRPSLAKRLGRFFGAAIGTSANSSSTSSPKAADSKSKPPDFVGPELAAKAEDGSGVTEQPAALPPSDVSAVVAASASEPQQEEQTGLKRAPAVDVEEPVINTYAILSLTSTSADGSDAAGQAELLAASAVDDSSASAKSEVITTQGSHSENQLAASKADAEAAMPMLQAFLRQAGLSQHLRLSLTADQITEPSQRRSSEQDEGGTNSNGHEDLPAALAIQPATEAAYQADEGAITVRGKLPCGSDLLLHLVPAGQPS